MPYCYKNLHVKYNRKRINSNLPKLWERLSFKDGQIDPISRNFALKNAKSTFQVAARKVCRPQKKNNKLKLNKFADEKTFLILAFSFIYQIVCYVYWRFNKKAVQKS